MPRLPRRILAAALLLPLLASGGLSCGPRPLHVAKSEADFDFEHGRYAEAAPAYLEIIDRFPGDWEVEYRYGLCLARLGDPQRARTHIETAAARNPGSQEVVFALADVYAELNERARMTQLLRTRATDYGDTEAWLKLAELARGLNDLDLEDFAIEQSLRMRSDGQWQAYVRDAERQEAKGNSDLALRRLRQAYFLNPNSPVVVALLRERGEDPAPQLGLPPES